jgi:transposase
VAQIGAATMIGKELEARILRLFAAEKWKVGTIAAQLGVHHSTVRRVLAQAGVEEVKRPQRASMVEPFLPFVEATLERYPRLSAARLYQKVYERGYRGGPDHFRHLVARLRPKSKAEAFHRLRTLPGEQGQVDWGHFGKLSVGRAECSLMAFVLVLSFSRKIFLRFFLDAALASFLRGHVHAFSAWNGLPRTLLYEYVARHILVVLLPGALCARACSASDAIVADALIRSFRAT